jgi:hypothetical protein
MMAALLQRYVLSSKPKPVTMKMCCELLRVWDRIWGFNSDDGTEGYSGQTR